MENMLQRFLDAGMLNMVEDDEKFKHLQQTAQDLAAKPAKNRTDVIKSTLVALDPEAPPQEATFEKVEEALKKHWQTVKAKFPDIPRQLLRGILFEALRIRGQKDAPTAAIIWLTGASYLPYSRLGREEQVCRSFLTDMGSIAEKKAIEEWTSNYEYTPPTIPTLEVDFEVEPPMVDKDALTKHLEAASGPSNAEGETTGPNPTSNWPNSGQTWSHQFAPRAATGIAEVINNSYGVLLDSIIEAFKQAGTELSGHNTLINSAIEAAINQVAQGATINERRSSLLWWRQTLYSETLTQSYRQLDLAEAALLMGYDLYKQVPDFHPQSVEFLLREAVQHIAHSQEPSASERITLVDFCQQLRESTYVPVLVKALGSADSGEVGRVPLLSVVKSSLSGESFDSTKLLDRVGIAGETEIKFEELAVWMFRDLQANHLATQKQ